MLPRLGTNPRFVLCSLVLVGCAYQADSFTTTHEPFRGVRITVDCLDIALDHQSPKIAGSNVVTYSFGNRCDDPVTVDLAAARVYGKADDGAEMSLFAFDPYHEIRAMRLDGRAVGREAIEYPSDRMLERMCIDPAPITRASEPRWICFYDRD